LLEVQVRQTSPPILPARWLVDGQQNLIVVGRYAYGWATAKLDERGNQRWFAFYPGIYDTYVVGLTTNLQGEIFVTGNSRISAAPAPEFYGPAIFTMKYDPNGHLLWMSRFYLGEGNDSHFEPTDPVVADDTGGAYVVGHVLSEEPNPSPNILK